MSYRWGMIWSDMHEPYADRRAIDLLYRFADDAKPNFHVNIGDLMNCAAMSRHNKAKQKIKVYNPIEQDFEAADTYWKMLEQINPKADKYYIEGNHEFWVSQYAEENPEVGSDYDIEKRLNLKKRGIQFYPYEKQRVKPLKLGKLDLVHGWYCNKHHTGKTSEETTRNIIYGHTHDVQESTKKGLITGRHTAISIGHLTDERSRAMGYLRTPTNWMKAFAIVQFDTESGHFDIEVKRIPDYKFFWSGKLWKN